MPEAASAAHDRGVNNFHFTEALVNDHIADLLADAGRSRAVRSAHRARFRLRRGRVGGVT